MCSLQGLSSATSVFPSLKNCLPSAFLSNSSLKLWFPEINGALCQVMCEASRETRHLHRAVVLLDVRKTVLWYYKPRCERVKDTFCIMF